jgi:hypothetical protein
MSLTTEPSICIPRTLHNITWREVKDTFEAILGRGTVERVDIVRKRDDPSPFCRVFVHMRYWPLNVPEAAEMRDRLIAGEPVRIVYDDPWFWKCSASRTPKPERTRQKTTPYVEFSKRPDSPVRERPSSPVRERPSSPALDPLASKDDPETTVVTEECVVWAE